MLSGITLLIFGLILLLFGARLMKLFIVLYGAIIGMTVVSFVTGGLNLSDIMRAIVIIIGACAGGVLFFGLYRFMAKIIVAFISGNILLVIANAVDAPFILGLIFAIALGLTVFMLMGKHDVISKIFVIVSSIHGSTLVLAGILVLVGSISQAQVADGSYSDIVLNAPWKYLAIAAGTFVGIGLQARYWRNSDSKSSSS